MKCTGLINTAHFLSLKSWELVSPCSRGCKDTSYIRIGVAWMKSKHDKGTIFQSSIMCAFKIVVVGWSINADRDGGHTRHLSVFLTTKQYRNFQGLTTSRHQPMCNWTVVFTFFHSAPPVALLAGCLCGSRHARNPPSKPMSWYCGSQETCSSDKQCKRHIQSTPRASCNHTRMRDQDSLFTHSVRHAVNLIVDWWLSVRTVAGTALVCSFSPWASVPGESDGGWGGWWTVGLEFALTRKCLATVNPSDDERESCSFFTFPTTTLLAAFL